ncbi:Flagellar biosynthesis protein FlhB [Candidatus Syntrophocurvum alkaliphilum]|uniref:Flagellar biosynthetic protein FlhB n=1 Tax=Candidatus Syntrophocurvum alkaliphilum TaxID=2293317 RepID=A0A6I6DET6_9FIRM|nr:flagellar biosynthesis protein FlhB [Candidatus Syntrophocurvum alkaliphilum]QGT99182.1 Flagellar biosynthesis protein FlhB [Candidatus Syntrophocurvum alkaliphilum]
MEVNKYFLLDLQLFAEGDTGEKTEKATPRRREEARKKGQVFKSNDLNSAIILVAGATVVFLTFPYMIDNVKEFTTFYLLERTNHEFTNEYVYFLLIEVLILLAKTLFPIFLTTFVTALIINYLQVGFIFSGEPLKPKLERLNPVKGFQRIFSKRALVELFKSLVKVITIGFIVYTTIMKYFYIFPRFVDMELIATIRIISIILFEIALKAALVFIIIGILDFLYQMYEYEKSLKMSKHDVKQEHKQTEGDPLIRSKQRQIQREAAMKRMMSEVPDADVIITNPTHFAVALKYQISDMDAPIIIAKGQDFIALRIREIGAQHDIAIVENPSLARTLFYNAEIGDEVPEDLYQAVAEVLAFVYKQKKIVL